MRKGMVRTIGRLVSEQQRILDRLARMIPRLERTDNESSASKNSSRKRLVCEKCDRRFALPMHLGRHIAMSHRRKRAA